MAYNVPSPLYHEKKRQVNSSRAGFVTILSDLKLLKANLEASVIGDAQLLHEKTFFWQSNTKHFFLF